MDQLSRDVLHPGKILPESFMMPTHTNALRLAHYFGTTPEYWLEMQLQYDLGHAQEKWTERIEREITPLSEQNFFWSPPEEAQTARKKKEYKNPKLEELKIKAQKQMHKQASI